jgi:hypothetical protein
MAEWFFSKVEAVEELTALVWPDFIEVQGCVVRRSSYSAENFATWWDQYGAEPWRIEAVLNEVHLYDWVSDFNPVDLPRLEAVAERIAAAWNSALTRTFPDRVFIVSYETEPDAYGPTVTFHQAVPDVP